jgi:hypothetical protein
MGLPASWHAAGFTATSASTATIACAASNQQPFFPPFFFFAI